MRALAVAVIVAVIVASSAAVLWSYAIHPMPLLAAVLLIAGPVAMGGAIGYLLREADHEARRAGVGPRP